MSPIAINKYINQFIIIYLVPSKYISQMIDWEWKWSHLRMAVKFKKFHIRLGEKTKQPHYKVLSCEAQVMNEV